MSPEGRDRHNCSVFRGTLLFRVPVLRNRDGTEQNFGSSAELGRNKIFKFPRNAEPGWNKTLIVGGNV